MSDPVSARAARPSSVEPNSVRARTALPLGGAADRTASPKIPRAALARLDVVADICPQVFLRTLGMIAQRDIVPVAMHFEQTSRSLRFAIEVEGLGDQQAAILVAKIAELVRVRSARWARPRRR